MKNFKVAMPIGRHGSFHNGFKKALLLFSFFIAVSLQFLNAQTITSAGNGNWSSTTPNAPWPGGVVPTSANDVILNHNVIINANGQGCKTMTINSGGLLRFSGQSSTNLFSVNGNFI